MPFSAEQCWATSDKTRAGDLVLDHIDTRCSARVLLGREAKVLDVQLLFDEDLHCLNETDFEAAG